MKKTPQLKTQSLNNRRQFLLFPLALVGSYLLPTISAAEPDKITEKPVDEGCPLNSGGPSLLNSEWRVDSVYGNKIPSAVDFVMKVNQNSLTGISGCNVYTVNFKQVGYTGFRITKMNKGKNACQVIKPVEGGPSINVGDLEGGYLRTLGRMGSVEQFEDRLVFYNRNGNKGIVMKKKS